MLSDIGRQVLRNVETERVFATIDREKDDLDRLYRVSQQFIRSQTLTDTFHTTLQTAQRMCNAGWAVLVLREEGRLTLAASVGLSPVPAASDLPNDGRGVAACVAKQELVAMTGCTVEQVRSMLGVEVTIPPECMKWVPLRERGECTGVLVVAGAARGFAWYVDDRLQMVADMASMAVSNARLYASMERMATTDGLTGLLNHRTFQEKLLDALSRAARYRHPTSVILTDIDHFKTVNDTYGHPVGDDVIRWVADVLRQEARATDVVARYGGEEFAVVMEQTDGPGGLRMAERMRQAVQSKVLQTELGTLRVTMSLGVATFPTHAADKQRLMEKADQALYAAKRGGRNRAVVATDGAAMPLAVEKA
jgi:diguanylate cyclase (GGDEF)-like protein